MPVPDPRGNGAVQLVVTDLDGTLSDAAERIHPASLRAIRDLEAGGIPVLVATGRRLRMACAVLEAGGLTGPAVVLDGAIGLDLRDGRVFHQVAFPTAAARRVLEAFAAAGLSPCVYVDRPEVDLVVGEHPSTNPGHLARARPWVAIDDLARVVAAEPVYAFAVVGRPAALLEPVLGAVGPAGSASIVHDLIYGGSTLQVRPPEISKWSGVLAYCAEQGIDPAASWPSATAPTTWSCWRAPPWPARSPPPPRTVLARADHVIGPPSSGGWAAVLDLVGGPAGAG